MTSRPASSGASPFKQPKAVFAVAFACVVSFMGIGLVDPILPAISHQLHASPSQVTLLFTSYLVVTAVAMLITNWVSSRLGAKRTLIAGLILIVVFSALAGTSHSIGGIVGFRAGWGVGNALFIATSLAVIVASASGGFAGAIVLYETALGVGIAMGPLVGGLLGEVSWRGPFFGVAALMAIALISTIVLVEKTPRPPHKTRLSAPLRALRHRGLLTMSLTALCYNWGFFTVLGYAPFPMALSPIKLGLVFTGWGMLVAIFAVFGAPRLQAAFGIAKTMYGNLAAFAIIVLVIAIWTTDRKVLIPAVIASGIFIGINNTITTQAVMTVAPVERPVASAAYSFVRFIGGGLAPYAAGRLVSAAGIHVPFFIGAAVIVLGIAILATAHGLLGNAERAQAQEVTTTARPAPATTVSPAFAVPPARMVPAGGNGSGRHTSGYPIDGGSVAVLTGMVRSSGGAPLAGAAVTIMDSSGAQMGRGIAGADGRFSIEGVRPGTYTALVTAPGHRPLAAMIAFSGPHEAAEFMLDAAGTVTGLVRRAARLGPTAGTSGAPAGYADGRHAASPDGTPERGGISPLDGGPYDLAWDGASGGTLAGASVLLSDSTGEIVARAVTGPDGAYRLTGLPEGNYTVTARKESFQPAGVAVAVSAGREARADVTLTGIATLAGVVRQAEGGAPLAGASITLTDTSGQIVAGAVTGPDGAYRFTGVPDGHYTVVASGFDPVATPLTLSAGQDLNVHLAMGQNRGERPVPAWSGELWQSGGHLADGDWPSRPDAVG